MCVVLSVVVVVVFLGPEVTEVTRSPAYPARHICAMPRPTATPTAAAVALAVRPWVGSNGFSHAKNFAHLLLARDFAHLPRNCVNFAHLTCNLQFSLARSARPIAHQIRSRPDCRAASPPGPTAHTRDSPHASMVARTPTLHSAATLAALYASSSDSSTATAFARSSASRCSRVLSPTISGSSSLVSLGPPSGVVAVAATPLPAAGAGELAASFFCRAAAAIRFTLAAALPKRARFFLGCCTLVLFGGSSVRGGAGAAGVCAKGVARWRRPPR